MVIQQNKEKDYYLVGNKEDKYISNSLLNALDPELGGSPQKALSFFEKGASIESTRSIENGKIIHLYSEKAQDFGIAETPRPENMIGDMADAFYERLKKPFQVAVSPAVITSDLKTESGRSAEILTTKNSYEKLADKLKLDFDLTVALIREAREAAAAYKSYKEYTLVDKFGNECIEYIEELKKLDNKIILSKADKIIVEGVIKSMRDNPLVNQFYALADQFDTNLVYKEYDIYFTIHGYKAKARIDNLYIDLVNRIIYINDLKTTSKGLARFVKAIADWRYYRQLAFYKKAVQVAISTGYLKVEGHNLADFRIVCNNIAVETTPDYNCCIFNVDDLLDKGKEELISLSTRYDFHESKNIWNKSMEEVLGGGVIPVKKEHVTKYLYGNG